MRRFHLVLITLWALLPLALAGCGSNGSAATPQQNTATVYVNGSDAPPVASVLAFQITIDSITLSDGHNTFPVLNTPTQLEFSRFLGLRTLLGLNNVPPGAYTQAVVTLENPIISYLDNTTSPATVKTMAPPQTSLTQSQITMALNPMLQVSQNQLGGLFMHFNLRNSILVDNTGQITGVINPDITFRPLLPGDDDAEIDELHGSVISVNTGGNSFVMQRVNGRLFTVDANTQTDWEPAGANLGNLPVSAIVEVSGKVQADGSILADGVEVLTTDKEWISGIVLGANPTTGDASSVTVLVRDQIPVVPGIAVGNTATANVDSNTVFAIRYFPMPVGILLFNRSSLVLGQNVGIGGVMDNTVNPPALDARRIVLRRQGVDGHAVAGTIQVTSGNQGSFMLQNNGFWGYLLNGPVQVMTTTLTRFVNLSGLSAVTPQMQIRVVGLLLRDSNGNPVLVAGRVEDLDGEP